MSDSDDSHDSGADPPSNKARSPLASLRDGILISAALIFFYGYFYLYETLEHLGVQHSEMPSELYDILVFGGSLFLTEHVVTIFVLIAATSVVAGIISQIVSMRPIASSLVFCAALGAAIFLLREIPVWAGDAAQSRALAIATRSDVRMVKFELKDDARKHFDRCFLSANDKGTLRVAFESSEATYVLIPSSQQCDVLIGQGIKLPTRTYRVDKDSFYTLYETTD